MKKTFTKVTAFDVVNLLCKTDREHKEKGVSFQELQSALSHYIQPTDPNLVLRLIHADIKSSRLLKNHLGNYIAYNTFLTCSEISLHFNIISQLFEKNKNLQETGVTYNQLHSTLTFSLSKKADSSLILKIIDIGIQSSKFLKNHLGNYIMNPNPPVDAEDDSTSDREAESAGAIDPVRSQSKRDKEGPDSEEKMDDEQEVVEIKEPKKRRIRRPKKFLDDLGINIRDGDSQNSESSIKTLLMYNSGRRIRKKTKYDPSEYFLTPLVRKKRPAGLPPDEPKVKLKRGRPPYKKIAALAAEAAKNACAESAVKESATVGPSMKDSIVKRKPLFQAAVMEEVHARSKASGLKDQCYICSKYACVNSHKTFACSLCLNIAHEGCIEGEQFYKQLKKWRCSECLVNNPAICNSCDEEYKDGVMLMCDYCEEFFHPQCHTPPVTRNITNTSAWRCYLCPNISLADTLMGGREDLKSCVGTFAFSSSATKSPTETCRTPARVPSLSDSASFIPPKNINISDHQQSSTTFYDTVIKTEPPDDYEQTEESPHHHDTEPASYKFHRPNEPIPDVEDWTAKQVADYFAERFGAIVGNAFLVQEIDGKSLKLMSRNDVTEQLGLHFGIALKVLYYVRKIQLNTNIIHKLWS